MTQAERILQFYKQLPPVQVPKGVEVMNPYSDPIAWELTETFYRKFYEDNNHRILLFGINPGRFGGGITGIPFTDPIRLEKDCGIANPYRKVPELSSEFVYKVVEGWGGAKRFYGDCMISALSPLGYTREGKNLNYYDDRALLSNVEGFIVHCIQKQKELIDSRSTVLCLGEGANSKYFRKLNDRYRFFENIISLPHPRWVMQYRRKRIDEFVQLYIKTLSSV